MNYRYLVHVTVLGTHAAALCGTWRHSCSICIKALQARHSGLAQAVQADRQTLLPNKGHSCNRLCVPRCDLLGAKPGRVGMHVLPYFCRYCLCNLCTCSMSRLTRSAHQEPLVIAWHAGMLYEIPIPSSTHLLCLHAMRCILEPGDQLTLQTHARIRAQGSTDPRSQHSRARHTAAYLRVYQKQGAVRVAGLHNFGLALCDRLLVELVHHLPHLLQQHTGVFHYKQSTVWQADSAQPVSAAACGATACLHADRATRTGRNAPG